LLRQSRLDQGYCGCQQIQEGCFVPTFSGQWYALIVRRTVGRPSVSLRLGSKLGS
jgi:hypothetical protein